MHCEVTKHLIISMIKFCMALANLKTTSADLHKVLSEAGVSVSNQTICRRLCSAQLKASIPRKKPFLNKTHRQKRVDWAKEHVKWAAEEWKWVLCSDEPTISISRWQQHHGA